MPSNEVKETTNCAPTKEARLPFALNDLKKTVNAVQMQNSLLKCKFLSNSAPGGLIVLLKITLICTHTNTRVGVRLFLLTQEFNAMVLGVACSAAALHTHTHTRGNTLTLKQHFIDLTMTAPV